jgi:hypothetical protein
MQDCAVGPLVQDRIEVRHVQLRQAKLGADSLRDGERVTALDESTLHGSIFIAATRHPPDDL